MEQRDGTVVVKNVVLLTGCELRHRFVSKILPLDGEINVFRTYRESVAGTIKDLVSRAPADQSTVQRSHLEARALSEEDFFGAVVDMVPDLSNPVDIPRGDINEKKRVEEVMALAPDLLVAYGCSLIGELLVAGFANRFVNVHLGLSPYYRGTGTNFWPLVNNDPEYLGATFMHMDLGVDTGRVIHQIRARVFPGDTPHRIGNRLIVDMARTLVQLVRKFENLKTMRPVCAPANTKVYRKCDYSEEATVMLYRNFKDGLVDKYLAEREERDRRVPIISNPVLA